jgi:hypothetical protein
VERVETGAAVSLLDGSIKGFASGHQIDINLEVLEGLRDLFRQLQQKVDKLNEVRILKSTVIKVRASSLQ